MDRRTEGRCADGGWRFEGQRAALKPPSGLTRGAGPRPVLLRGGESRGQAAVPLFAPRTPTPGSTHGRGLKSSNNDLTCVYPSLACPEVTRTQRRTRKKIPDAKKPLSDALWPWTSSPPRPTSPSWEDVRLLRPSLKPSILFSCLKFFFF